MQVGVLSKILALRRPHIMADVRDDSERIHFRRHRKERCSPNNVEPHGRASSTRVRRAEYMTSAHTDGQLRARGVRKLLRQIVPYLFSMCSPCPSQKSRK